MSFIDNILAKFRKKRQEDALMPKVEESPAVKAEQPKAEAKKEAKRAIECICGYKFSADVKKTVNLMCPWCGKLIE